MEIREATDKDIPEIVELLRVSLGEASIKKTADTWNWKHIENPFGPSYVLVAEEEGKLIGLRAFMRWRWRNGERTFEAVRAVDTATHPDHRGKGIFKTLTLQLLEELKEKGVDFVFNTPNDKSKPGYLKMGWKEAFKLPVRLRPFLRIPKVLYEDEVTLDYRAWQLTPDLPLLQVDWPVPPKGMDYAKGYLSWRYAQNPILNYGYFGKENKDVKLLCLFRIKRHSRFTELRVCDLLLEDRAGNLRYLRKEVKKITKAFGVSVATCAPMEGPAQKLLSKFGFLRQRALGLQLTTRDIETNPIEFFGASERPILPFGAMELF